jgi:hypothetical protein
MLGDSALGAGVIGAAGIAGVGESSGTVAEVGFVRDASFVEVDAGLLEAFATLLWFFFFFFECFATLTDLPLFDATWCSCLCFLTALSRFWLLWATCFEGADAIGGTIIGVGGASGSAAIGVTAGSGFVGLQAATTANKAATNHGRADFTMYFLLGLGDLFQRLTQVAPLVDFPKHRRQGSPDPWRSTR